ncbi:MAG: tRNA pseudouridine(13) synthase TruD [Helicobacteraceae bacterium]|nr:tRNA pseudouridine(13) synthase TruD [Helicobacteraceae bacterium]
MDVHFAQNSKDFVVEEIPLYEPCGSGDHIFVRIRKKGVSTWEAIAAFSERLGVKSRDVGYAGLKDKQAMSVQTLSLPYKYEQELGRFDHPSIKILEAKRHQNKLKIGHLKGNRFFVRLKKARPIDALKLSEALDHIAASGMPNFFGFQRFGKDGDNYKTARAFLDGTAKVRGRKMQQFLISALQSERFNAWLTKRIEISHVMHTFEPCEIAKELDLSAEAATVAKAQPHFFKLLEGDLMCHYPHGKIFVAEDLSSEAKRFAAKAVSPTGILSGHRTPRAIYAAGKLEAEFFEDIPSSGDRRYAWVFPEIESKKFVQSEGHFEMSFTLPKGAYATALIEELIHNELQSERAI